MKRVEVRLLALFLLLPFGVWSFNPNSSITEDCYFYLVVARNIVTEGVQTFSGVYPTNGVHPLWQYLLTGYTWVVSLFDPDLLYKAAYAAPLSALLLILGAANFARVARRLELDPLLLLAPQVGFLTAFSMLYSEAHASYFCLSLLARLAVDGSPRGRPLWIGLAAALVFLARLDSVFLVAAFYVWYWRGEPAKGRVFASASVAALPALTYLASNRIFFGGWVPISGWLKSSFPFLHLGTPFLHEGVVMGVFGYHLVFGVAPIALGGVTLVLLRKRLAGPRSLLGPFFWGSLLHWVYIALFTKEYTLWYWYFVLPVVLGSLAFATLLAHYNVPQRVQRAAAITLLVGVATVIVVDKRSLDFEVHAGRQSTRTLRFVEERGIEDTTILTTEWPGVVAFYTRNRIVSIDMLTGNRKLFGEMVASGDALRFLIDYCRERGKPVNYLIYNGGWQWIDRDEEPHRLTYFNPKLVPARVEIGRLTLRQPELELTDPPFLVWRLGSEGVETGREARGF